MADVYGRLTGRAGVCLGTLGPGALNLVTAVADAYLDRAPLVALTGQGDLERMHKESHQYIDLLRVMRPITKWNARLSDAGDHPRGRAQGVQGRRGREAGRDPHRAARGRDGGGDRRRAAAAQPPVPPEPAARELLQGGRPDPRRAQAGRARRQRRRARRRRARRCASSCARPASRWPRRSWARACCRPTAPSALGSVGLQSGDYRMAGFDEADVVLAIGYDLVEHSPEHWNPRRDKKIICIDSVPAEIDEYFIPEVELDRRHLPRAHAARRGVPARAAPGRLDASCATWCWAASSRPRTTTPSRCSRRARSTRSARRSGARTS